MDRPQLAAGLLAAALALGAAFAAPAGAALTADSMFEPETVVAIELGLPKASEEALEAEPDEYVEGTFSIAETDGTPAGIAAYSTPVPVGIRLKGNAGSFRDLGGKAAFKVKFNAFGGSKYLGLKKLTLNNMVQDPSMVHEALVYPAFRAAGVPAPHAGYAYLYVNGVDYGLHLNLETLDDVALKKIFGAFDDPQHLYEGGPVFDVVPGDLGKFEVDEGDEEDLGDLEALIAAANAGTPSFTPRLAPVADLAEMTKFWAAERYLGQWDGYSSKFVNNYYLYSSAAGVFQMLPWGTDQTLHHWWYPFTGKGGTLFQQCVSEPACLAAYETDLEAVEASTTALDLEPRVEALANLLAPWQEMEIADSERAQNDAAEIEEAVDEVLEFLQLRPGVLANWLDTGEIPPDQEPEEGGEETGPDSGTPNPFEKVPPATQPTTISTRLDLDRSKLGRGLLVVRGTVSGPGAISLTGNVGPAENRRRACAVEPRQVKAGAAVLHCRLSAAVRAQLADRPLTLRIAIGFQPGDGNAALAVSRLARLPRQALG